MYMYIHTYFIVTFTTERHLLTRTLNILDYFFKVCFFCDTKISVFCCQWTHGFISFYLHCENYWVLLQPKTGIQVPKGSCLMYIKKTKQVCWLSKREVLFCPLVKTVENNPLDYFFFFFLNNFTQNVCFSSGGILMIKPVMFKCCCRQCPLLWCARKRRDQTTLWRFWP